MHFLRARQYRGKLSTGRPFTSARSVVTTDGDSIAKDYEPSAMGWATAGAMIAISRKAQGLRSGGTALYRTLDHKTSAPPKSASKAHQPHQEPLAKIHLPAECQASPSHLFRHNQIVANLHDLSDKLQNGNAAAAATGGKMKGYSLRGWRKRLGISQQKS